MSLHLTSLTVWTAKVTFPCNFGEVKVTSQYTSTIDRILDDKQCSGSNKAILDMINKRVEE